MNTKMKMHEMPKVKKLIRTLAGFHQVDFAGSERNCTGPVSADQYLNQKYPWLVAVMDFEHSQHLGEGGKPMTQKQREDLYGLENGKVSSHKDQTSMQYAERKIKNAFRNTYESVLARLLHFRLYPHELTIEGLYAMAGQPVPAILITPVPPPPPVEEPMLSRESTSSISSQTDLQFQSLYREFSDNWIDEKLKVPTPRYHLKNTLNPVDVIRKRYLTPRQVKEIQVMVKGKVRVPSEKVPVYVEIQNRKKARAKELA
jgi:hypothetical protein